MAKIFHRNGLRVFATARNISKIESLTSSGIEVVQLDVTDITSLSKAVEHVSKVTNGKLDYLVSNAGGGMSYFSHTWLNIPDRMRRLLHPSPRHRSHSRPLFVRNQRLLPHHPHTSIHPPTYRIQRHSSLYRLNSRHRTTTMARKLQRVQSRRELPQQPITS